MKKITLLFAILFSLSFSFADGESNTITNDASTPLPPGSLTVNWTGFPCSYQGANWEIYVDYKIYDESLQQYVDDGGSIGLSLTTTSTVFVIEDLGSTGNKMYLIVEIDYYLKDPSNNVFCEHQQSFKYYCYNDFIGNNVSVDLDF